MVRIHVLALVSAKRSLNVKVDLPFDDNYGYFCTYAFEPSPNASQDGTYHFQPSPVIHGPNPYPDPLSLLYVILQS